MEKFWKWVVQSSANPEQTAATIKGLIIGIIPIALYFAGFLHLNILPEQLQVLADSVSQIIQAGLGIISAGIFLFGLLRKVMNLIRDIISNLHS